jgi:hypothetical protein
MTHTHRLILQAYMGFIYGLYNKADYMACYTAYFMAYFMAYYTAYYMAYNIKDRLFLLGPQPWCGKGSKYSAQYRSKIHH